MGQAGAPETTDCCCIGLTHQATLRCSIASRTVAGGLYPNPGLAVDAAGNVYGTTEAGGGSSNGGVVFKIDTSGHEAVLHTFTDGADGGNPFRGVVLDSVGNVYGTVADFGMLPGDAQGGGVVFKIDTAGNYTVLHTFAGGTEGSNPIGLLVIDTKGNLYGTTEFGGIAPGLRGYGGVFKLGTSGNLTVLHTFNGGADGGATEAGVVLDSRGNLYGTTTVGGADGGGVVYKITR
jgi:uncharacterized repeat protein (TIGR03803 family)